MANKFTKGITLLKVEGPKRLIVEAGRYITSEVKLTYDAASLPLLINGMISDFSKKAQNVNSVEETVDFAAAYSYMGINIKPFQDRAEIIAFLHILKTRKIETMLEIGTDRGGSLFLFSRIASPGARIISLNMPFSRLNGVAMRERYKLYRSFATKSQTIDIIEGDSHHIGMLEKVKLASNGKKFDFLFIDGDHSYEGVKRDYEMYSGLVRKGGIIGFHDIIKWEEKRTNPVRKLWEEVRGGYKNEEICYKNGCGIGILHL